METLNTSSISKKTWGIVAGVIVVLVAGYLIFSGGKADENKYTEDLEKEEQTAKKMAFSEFVKKGESSKCEVKQYVGDMTSKGTVYIDGERIRGDFSTIIDGKTMTSSFILRDGNSYTWSSALPSMGFIVKVDNGVRGDEGESMSATYNWNAEQIGDYNCEPWVADQSMFALPRGVTFSEVNPK